jgi:transposase
MRKIREILRLKWESGMTARQIAQSLSISHSTVLDMLRRVEQSGLSWPLPDVDDATLEARLYPGNPKPAGKRPEPDMPYIHRELRRKGVTLQLLWEEYKRQNPDGLQYSQFCEHYRQWAGKLDVVLRQTHRAGERMDVDFAGQTVPVVDRKTGEVREAQIFIATLTASNYTYAEAVWSQELPTWIMLHCRAFEFFGGVPATVVPDNLKSGVARACRYEPDVNPTYQEMAAYYGTVILPARPIKPRDKGKVESAVLVVERWILAVLRNRTFFSLSELNQAIVEELERLNNRPFQKLEGTRRTLYETLERPALKPLPATRYEFAQWRKAKVNIDYHVEVAHNFYSVPYQLVRQQVDVRFTATTVEILLAGKRVASHPRACGKGHYVTQNSHRPASHQKHLEWTPSRMVTWAESVGPKTAALVAGIFEAKPHPEQGYRSCLGIIRLARSYGVKRLEAAAARALSFGVCSYQSVKSILQRKLDQAPPDPPQTELPLPVHDNLRGPGYYAQGGGNRC